ncbi:MAG: hypothetical protein ACOYYS_00490 [Chloroflexota bacterium]
MSRKQHAFLLGLCFLAWLLFLTLGIPSNYYLDYSPTVKILIAVGTVLFFIPPFTFWGLRVVKPKNYFAASIVFCVYGTLGVFLLDLLYCGFYQGYGLGFLQSHWLQTLGYIMLWPEVPAIGWIMQKRYT